MAAGYSIKGQYIPPLPRMHLTAEMTSGTGRFWMSSSSPPANRHVEGEKGGCSRWWESTSSNLPWVQQ